MKKPVLILIAVIGIGVTLFLLMHSYRNNFHDNISKLPTMYAYDTFRKSINSAYFVESKSEIEELVNFYKKIEKDPSSRPIMNFRIRTLPQKQPVYIMGYTNEDSVVAEIYCYYKFGAIYDGNLHGYVYAKTLHQNPPQSLK